MRRRRVLPNAAWLELRQRDVSRHESGVRLAGWRAMRNGTRLRAGAGSWWRARIEVAITLAAATVISACHGAATPSATLAMRDLPIALAARYCDDPCLASTPAPRDFCLAVSASDDMAKQPLYQRIRLVELGRASYDATAAAACVSALTCNDVARLTYYFAGNAVRVPDPFQVPEPCKHIFTGNGGATTDCDDDVECAPGLRCWGHGNHTCVQPASDGSQCGRSAPCGDGERCVAGLCAPNIALPIAATCVARTFDDCNDIYCSVQPCQAGAYCAAMAEDVRRCQARIPLGGACPETNDPACDDDATCMHGVCVALGQFVAACNGKLCESNEYCEPASQTCIKFAHRGEPCGYAGQCLNSLCLLDSTKTCSDPSLCDAACPPTSCGANGKCLVGLLGDACVNDADCNFPAGANIGQGCVNRVCRRVDSPADTW